MEIKTVSIIGLGALGILFGQHLAEHMPEENLRVIADKDRIDRYRRDGVFCNGKRCSFRYISPEDTCMPADLLIFAVKFNDLNDAISSAKRQVGERTIILSLLNGITSEEVIGQVFGMEKMLYCVAQGMDAVKTDNRLNYQHMGMLVFGDGSFGVRSRKTQTVSQFFTGAGIPHRIDTDMKKRLWSKFMFNVGVNQPVAVFEGDYGQIQRQGPARDMMINAMREVIVLSGKEGVGLTEADLQYWLKILDTLNPKGKPSMRQDLEARRYSEVKLFSGTVLSLGKKHGLSFPVNQMLYDKIRSVESQY